LIQTLESLEKRKNSNSFLKNIAVDVVVKKSHELAIPCTQGYTYLFLVNLITEPISVKNVNGHGKILP